MSNAHGATHRLPGVVLGLILSGGCSGSPQGPSPVDGPAPGPRPGLPLGGYDLTLSLPECVALPVAERTRRYVALIDRDLATGAHVVTLSGATFLYPGPPARRPVPLGPHQFPAWILGEEVRFNLWGDWNSAWGGQVVEQMSTGQWLEIMGDAGGPLGTPTITAVGSANVVFCQDAGPTNHCAEERLSSCGSAMTLTFVPRW